MTRSGSQRLASRGWHVTAADVTAVLDRASWEIVTAEERSRTLDRHAVQLRDAVVRAIRRG